MQRVAVIGAGPSGIYAASALLARDDLLVDVIDRSATPFGLVRYGVAPDHVEIKSVARRLGQVLSDKRVTFHGNVGIGRDVSFAELRAAYAAVVLATGAPHPRRLGVPGEDLPGHVPAGHLVDWYNGRPGALRPPGFPAGKVAVIGAGNVALDAARVLLKAGPGLAHTDVTDAVLGELDREPAHEVTIVIRRGVVDTKFTPAELRDLNKLEDVDIVVDPAELDPPVEAADRVVAARVETFRQWSQTPATGAPKVLRFRFRQTPTGLIGRDRVEALELTGENGSWHLPVDAVVSAIGFSGEAIDGVPFDARSGRIPNDEGRILPGVYIVGWAKRGPSGVIGSNKTCAAETVALLLDDLPAEAGAEATDGIGPLLRERGCRAVDWQGWTEIDAAEIATGESKGRARTKIADSTSLIEIARGQRTATTEKETGS